MVTKGACPTRVAFTHDTCFLNGAADAMLADVTGFAARKDPY